MGALHLCEHCGQPLPIRRPHGSALAARERVAVHHGHIDVRRPARDALGQHLRTFIGQDGEQAALNLVGRESARRDALARPFVFDDRRGDGVDGLLPVRVVGVPAPTGLAAKAAGVVQPVSDGDIALARGTRRVATAPHRVRDVEAGQVGHGKGAHGEAVGLEGPVHGLRRRAVFHQILGMAAIHGKDAVADESVAHAGHDRLLLERHRQRQRCGQHVGRGVPRADDFQQSHQIGRREEVQADHVLRPAGRGGNRVDVEVRRVGGKHGVRQGEGLEAPEDLEFHGHVLERRFDDERAVAERGPIVGDRHQADARGPRLVAQPRALEMPRIHRHDALKGGGHGGGVAFDDAGGQTRLGKRDGNAHAHRAAADDPDARDGTRRDIFETGNAGGVLLSPRHVGQRAGLVRRYVCRHRHTRSISAAMP